MELPTDTGDRKPFPILDDSTRPFFDGAKRGRLMLRRCRRCQTFAWPSAGLYMVVRPRCPTCFSDDMEWSPARGNGTIHSFAVVHQIGDPAFRDDLPFELASIELVEGVRLTARVVSFEGQQLEVGMPVEVLFTSISDEISLPMFKPSDRRAGAT